MTQPSMTPTLMFIPDIKGFTSYLSKANHNMGTRVITELLNEILDANYIGLKMMDIEGDAIFFYALEDKIPPFSAVVNQAKEIFLRFETKLEQLIKELEPFSNFQKHEKKLGLKIIVHYGLVDFSQVGKKMKLIGEPVLQVHFMQKNSIPYDEYFMLSEAYLNMVDEQEVEEKLNWAKIESGSDEYRHLGRIYYKYINLKPLLKKSKLNPSLATTA